MPSQSTSGIPIIRLTGLHAEPTLDMLAAEEPLELRMSTGIAGTKQTRAIAVTMRTPGHDNELAAGFLFTEGIIQHAGDIQAIDPVEGKQDNTLCVALRDGLEPDIKKAERNFYTTSSCGVCGKTSIAAVRFVCEAGIDTQPIKVAATTLYALPDKLRAQQEVFSVTGGLHACALFTTDGSLVAMREDVGRHNALDKLIGYCLLHDQLPADQYVLLLSGRASFELVQKAAMAGIRIIAAVGAPSSLAAELAEELGITLVGFLRGERCNIYSGAERIVV